MFSSLKYAITDWRFQHSIDKYGSKMGCRLAAPFAGYHEECKAAKAPHLVDKQFRDAAECFSLDGFSTFWSKRNEILANSILGKIKAMEQMGNCPWSDGYVFARDSWREFPEMEELFKSGLNDILESIYGSHIKIFYATLQKSVRTSSQPEGSQLWHSDGGPGTCTNVIFYLSETTKGNGAMEIVRWHDSRKIFSDEKAAMRQLLLAREVQVRRPLQRMEAREILCNWYDGQIALRRINVSQPTGQPGMILAFRNNTIHKGGFPDEGRVRYAIIFHIYPSMTPISYEKYRNFGLSKTDPIPADVAF